MIGTGEWMLVGGELKDSGTDGTREKIGKIKNSHKNFHLESMKGRGTL